MLRINKLTTIIYKNEMINIRKHKKEQKPKPDLVFAVIVGGGTGDRGTSGPDIGRNRLDAR